jgi:hypothetical protein
LTTNNLNTTVNVETGENFADAMAAGASSTKLAVVQVKIFSISSLEVERKNWGEV